MDMRQSSLFSHSHQFPLLSPSLSLSLSLTLFFSSYLSPCFYLLLCVTASLSVCVSVSVCMLLHISLSTLSLCSHLLQQAATPKSLDPAIVSGESPYAWPTAGLAWRCSAGHASELHYFRRGSHYSLVSGGSRESKLRRRDETRREAYVVVM